MNNKSRNNNSSSRTRLGRRTVNQGLFSRFRSLVPLTSEIVRNSTNAEILSYAARAHNLDRGYNDTFIREYAGVSSPYFLGNAAIYSNSIIYRLPGDSFVVRSVENIVEDMNALSINNTRRIRIFYENREINPLAITGPLIYNAENRTYLASRAPTPQASLVVYLPNTYISFEDVLRTIMYIVTSNEDLSIANLNIVLDIAGQSELRGAATIRKGDKVKWSEDLPWNLEKIKTCIKQIPRNTKGYCGFSAILLHVLYYLNTDNITDKFGLPEDLIMKVKEYHLKHNSNKSYMEFIWANDEILLELSQYLSHDVFNLNTPVFDPTGEEGRKIMDIMNKCKLKIFTPKCHPLYEIRGRNYVLESGDEFNICLYFDADNKHYHFIKFVKMFNINVVGKNSATTNNVHFCHECNRTFAKGMLKHKCVTFKCCKCSKLFETSDELLNHQNPVDAADRSKIPEIYQSLHDNKNFDTKDLTCNNCKMTCYSVTCLLHHCYNSSERSDKCVAKIKKEVCELCLKLINTLTEHNCVGNEGTYKCYDCKLKIPKVEYNTHRCNLKKSKKRKTDSLSDEQTRFYAFDFESEFLDGETKTVIYPDGHVEAIKNSIHRVNLVCVRQCGTDREWMFQNIGDFIDWSVIEAENHRKSITFIAHNFKGYDGRLIFDYLLHDGKHTPTGLIWNMSKIMSFSIAHNIIFTDSLLHISARVSDMPKIFGLDESEFCKGYFPYMFNRPENIDYIGPIPAKEYFDPDHMSIEGRTKFLKWHSEQNGLYNFKTELSKYCISDVRILAKSLEVYLTDGMLYNEGLNPLSKITIASYAHQVFEKHRIEGQLKVLKEHEFLTAKAAMFGGRTDVRRMHVEYEIGGSKYAKYLDVQSLYPAVQFYKPMPAGTPTIHQEFNIVPEVSEMLNWFGIVIVDIEPTKYLHHPVLVHNRDGKLCATLKPLEKYACTCVELHEALRQDYKVTKVYEYHEYAQSTDMFKSYVRHFLKLKIEASGLPRNIKNLDDFEIYKQELKERLDIDVCYDDFKKNAGKKALAKLMLNSLWGKFAESKNYMKTALLDQDTYSLLFTGQVCSMFDVKFAHQFNNADIMVVYQNLQTALYDPHKAKRTNMAMAAHVTAWGRLTLWSEMNKLGKQVLYHDTDSIIYEFDSNDSTCYDIPEGQYLGEWEDETAGKPIVKFVSLGPKTYSYSYIDSNGEEVFESKCKGFTLNYANSQNVNYYSMVQLLKGEMEYIKTQDVKFNWSKSSGQMATYLQTKYLSGTYDKGYIDGDLCTYPFGYEKFINLNS
jgi:hypothetical protein